MDTHHQPSSNHHTFVSRTILGLPEVPGMAAWLKKRGVIRHEAQARGILVGLIVADFLVAFLVVYFFIIK